MRAVAILPVLLFHAALPGFSGGFLGVDIFFVISGFLITRILLRETLEGRFSIIAFYHRRVRRIFPALFVMLAATTLAAAFILGPIAFKHYGASLGATALFASNFLFWNQAGYFDSESLEKPLLHSWSLAVEEQFYLVWPLVLATFTRFNLQRHLLACLCVGTAASFMLAAAGGLSPAVFFLPFSRAWELGLGAIVAVAPLRLPAWASVPGMAALIGSIMLCSEQTPLFVASGIAALGTAVLICTEAGSANKLLALAPCVGIGLISYSLYLWHWPLLAFANYEWNDAPPVEVSLGVLLLSGVLAFLSWRFIEVPLRKGGGRLQAFALSGAAIVTAVATGGIIYAKEGFSQRYGPAAARLDAQITPLKPCASCSVGTTGNPSVVLWGDSFAMAARPAVEDFARRMGVGEIAFTQFACPPLFGAQKLGDSECEAFHESVQRRLRKLNPRLIILIARWSLATEPKGEHAFLVDSISHADTVANSRRALAEGLARTVAALTAMHPQATILVVGQAPELGSDAERCILANTQRGICSTVPGEALARQAYSDRLISMIDQRFPSVKAIYLRPGNCTSECPTRVGEIFLYRDSNHLTDSGAKLLLEPELNKIGAEIRLR